MLSEIKIKFFTHNQLVTLIVAATCIILFFFFPTANVFQNMIAMLSFLVLIPALCAKIVLKQDLSKWGLAKGNWKQGMKWTGISFIIALSFFYLIFHYTPLFENYGISQNISSSFRFFLFYEIIFIGFFLAAYEFFFRGVVMRGIFGDFGKRRILIQFFLFFFFILARRNFSWSAGEFLIISPFAGLISHKSKSLIYSFWASWLFIIIVDAVAIASASGK